MQHISLLILSHNYHIPQSFEISKNNYHKLNYVLSLDIPEFEMFSVKLKRIKKSSVSLSKFSLQLNIQLIMRFYKAPAKN